MTLKSTTGYLLILALTAQLVSGQTQQGAVNGIPFNKTSGQNNGGFEIRFAALILVAAVNPIVLYEDKKIHFGLSRELSLAFGQKGEFRTSFEYSFIFKPAPKHHFRGSLKYDLLGKKTTGDFIISRNFLSVGAGYFADSGGGGIFPEAAAGYRIGDGRLLLFPYIKLRHTFMLKKNKPDITDFSAGMIFSYHLF